MPESSRITIAKSSSIIGFEAPSRTKAGPGFDRYLTIENKRAYHIGNICGTCEFLFERLEGANQNISAASIAERLNTGGDIADPDFIETLSQVLPAGSYLISWYWS